MKALLTTIIVGAIIIPIIRIFIINSIYKQKEIIKEINKAIIDYANLYTDPIREDNNRDKERKEAMNIFRGLASKFYAHAQSIPLYGLLSFLGVVIKKEI